MSRAVRISGAISATVLGMTLVAAAPASAAVANGTCGNLQSPVHVQRAVNGAAVINVWDSNSSDFNCWRITATGGRKFSATVRIVKKNLSTGATSTSTQRFSRVSNVVGAPWMYQRHITVEAWVRPVGAAHDSWEKVTLVTHR
jgi:hypothetical protein